MKKIRVLHIVHNFLKGGIEGFLYYLCKKQKENAFLDIHILCCCDENKVVNKRILALGIPIHYVAIKPFDMRIRKYVQICNIANDFNIVHIHTFLPILCYSLAFSKAKILFTMHGAGSIRRDKNIKVKTKVFLLKWFLNNIASGIAHNSLFTQKYWKQRGITKCQYNEVVYNGVFFNECQNVSSVYADYPELRNKKIIGTTCRMIPWKRVDLLVKSYIKAVSQLPLDWDLLIVGEGPELEKLKRISCKNEEISKRIHFVGYKSNITDYQSAMDVCVFPSAEEPFGLVAIECLHLGKPVYVMHDGGGLVEIIKGISNEYIANSIEDLAEKLIKFSRGDIWYNTEKAISFSNKFTIKHTEEGYYQMYKKLMKQ